ncbi:hypothetical protein, partial [Estrella lausannensis]|uniref:hypothetical protein n=1 Tax=Estrella lausannensis TaxID=483423 RepID=UPI00117AC58D
MGKTNESESEILGKVAGFIDKNKEVFQSEKDAALHFNSLAMRVQCISKDNSLIDKLRECSLQLLPFDSNHVKESIEFFHTAIHVEQQQLQAMADWINLNKIPLGNLKLSMNELGNLLPRLECINFENYDIESEDVQTMVETLLRTDLKFATSDENSLVEIAKLCARQDARGVASHFKNFGIEDQDKIVEIAKLCARQDGWSTAGCFNNFGIEDQDKIVEIAKLCARQDGWSTAGCFNNFGIEDQDKIVEIAKLCARQNAGETAECFNHFGIEDQDKIVEIAKLCAEQNAGGTAQYFENFGIEDQDEIAEIAKLCAEQNGGGTARYFKNFGIEDQDKIVEIAKLCARQNGGVTASNFKNFGIEDQDKIVEIAKLCAQQDGGVTASNFKNFGIEDQDKIVEIAKLCAQQDSGGTALWFKNFGIEDQDKIVGIVKLCAEQNGRGTAYHFKKFGIEDQDKIVEIAKLCAQQNGGETAQYFKNFGIDDSHSASEVFSICVKADPMVLLYIENFSAVPTEVAKLSQLVQVFTTDEPKKELRSQLFEEMAALVKSLPLTEAHRKTIEDLRLKISELEAYVQNNAGLWFLASVVTISNMKTDAAEWMLGCGLWTELGLLQDPSLRVRLSKGMYDLAADEGSRMVWQAFIKSVRGTSGQRGLMLLAILFYELKKQGVAEEELVKVAVAISRFQNSRKSKFRDVYRVKLLLNTMHSFALSGIYSPDLKKQGLEKIFFDKQEERLEVIRQEERIVKNVTAVKGLLQLRDLSWPTADKDLDAQFRASLGELIPLEKLEGNASEKYDEIFGTCRNPGGLLTYAAGLKTLNEPAVMQCLGEFTVSVLDGTFKSKRYDKVNNPHLATVSQGNPDLLEKWNREITVDLKSFSLEAKGQNSLDLREWITNKLIIDNHLADADLSFVKRYLEAATDDQRAEIFSDLVAEIKLTMKEDEKNALRAQITIQKENNIKLTEELSRKKKGVETLGKSGQDVDTGRLKEFKNELKALEQDLSDSLKSLQRLDKDLKLLNQEVTKDPVLQNLNFQKACLLSAKAGKEVDTQRGIKILE